MHSANMDGKYFNFSSLLEFLVKEGKVYGMNLLKNKMCLIGTARRTLTNGGSLYREYQGPRLNCPEPDDCYYYFGKKNENQIYAYRQTNEALCSYEKIHVHTSSYVQPYLIATKNHQSIH